MNLKTVFIGFLILLALITSCNNARKSPKSQLNGILETIPKGMKLVWQDEFNSSELDRTKWFTQYYSQLNYVAHDNWDDFQSGTLPEPGMIFTDSTLILITNDSIPLQPFASNGRKISSIQTYDWLSDKAHFDNRLGGFIEARIKRNATPDATQVNGAFWLDSPGPDARYFVEKGNHALGVDGIRPRGQLFEIDLCEYITTEIVLHGNVSPEGKFERNIGHHIEKGDFVDKWTVHSMLWTPAGLKFYVDGRLVREWWDPNDIKSPNHMMNIFLGVYGNGGTVTMECDYIRFYQWDLGEKGNELPNAGFEYDGILFPWEGNGVLTESEQYKGKYGLQIHPGDSVYQYVYLDNNKPYELSFQGKGISEISVMVDNIKQVTGEVESTYNSVYNPGDNYTLFNLPFTTDPEYGDHSRTVRVTFVNDGAKDIFIDECNVLQIETL